MKKDPEGYPVWLDDPTNPDREIEIKIDCYYCQPGETPNGLAKKLGLILISHRKRDLTKDVVATIYEEGKGGMQFFYKKA